PSRTPFLAHEKHRDGRCDEGNRERSFDRLLRCICGQAITQGAATNLIVILQEIDEGEGRQNSTGLAPGPAAPMRRGLSLIDKTGGQSLRYILGGRALVVLIVA